MRVNRRTALGITIGLALLLVAATVTVILLRRGTAASQALDSCDDLAVLSCPRQVARAAVPVAGTSMHLAYASDRVPGRKESAAPPAAPMGLAGWTLDVLDTLDLSTKTMVTGTGWLRHVDPVNVSLGTGRHAVASLDGSRIDVFDDSGRPVSVYDGTTGTPLLMFAWNEHGLAAVTDRTGLKLTVRRDGSGAPVRLDSSAGPLTRLGTRNGYLAAVQYPDGATARLTHNAEGLLTSWSDAAGVSVQYGYDKAGRVASRTDATGAVTKYERTTSGDTMTVTMTGPVGAVTKDTVQAVSGGVVRTRVDSSGGVTRVESRGTQKMMQLPMGRKVSIELAPDPRWGMDAPVTASVSADGVASLREQRSGGDRTHPEAGQATRTVVSVDGKEWTTVYDPARRVSVATGPNGQHSEISFDTTGRVSAQSVAGQPPVAYQYDGSGRLAAVILGAAGEQRIWKYAYDKNRMTVTDPAGGVQVRTYSPNGALASVSGPGERGLTLSTDAAGVLSGYAGPDGNEYRAVQRADGRLAALTAPAGDSGVGFANYEYDQAGRITGVAWPDGKQAITRDAAGRVTAIDSGAGAWQWKYGENGLLASTSGPGASTAFTYAAGAVVGQRTQGPFDAAVTLTLDPLGRTATETVTGTPPVAYTYDHFGLITKVGDLTAERDPATGALLREKIGSLNRVWSYNGFGEPIGQKISTSNGAAVAEIRWERDRLGRVTAETTTAEGVTTAVRYTYDAAGRVVTATRNGQVTRYGYNAAGSLTEVTAPDGSVTRSTYDGRSALIERDGVRDKYDGAGRLASATSGSGTTTYRYDRAGVLLSVQPPQGPAVEYVNDALGRRVARKVNGTLTGGFAYLDQVRPAAELDAKGTVTTRYIYGVATTPAYLNRGGTNYLEVADATGSPVIVVNASDGTVTDTVSRDPWGQTISQTGTGRQSLGFAGGITDPDTGLVRFGARDYSPATGGWTAPDPLGVYGSGSANLYAYVSGDPVNRRDPGGSCEFVSIGVSVGLALGPFGGRLGFGLATAGTQLGGYYEGNWEYGAEGHATVDFKCQRRNEPSDSAPKLEDFDGHDVSWDAGIGPGGLGMEWDRNTAGVSLKVGPAAGVGGGTGYTGFWCWAGCPPEPDDPSEEDLIREAERQAGCEGVDAGLGLCNPSPSDPAIGSADDLGNPSNLCEADAGTTCNQPDNPTLPGAGGPGAIGDPHMRTAEGVFYDMQAVGEFVALSADAGDLEIQTRQAPVPGSRTLAINSAIAVKANGNRIVVTPDGTDRIKVTVNGKPRASEVHIGQRSVAIRLSDGSAIGIARNPLGLDLTLDLADGRKGHVMGLLGKLTTRDGAAVDAKQLNEYDTLYGRFAESWRVTPDKSLFDYGPGQSTATFTDRTFPDQAAPAVGDAARAAAEQLCRHLGIPAEALPPCVIDVAATGQAGFAASTATATGTRPGAAQLPSGRPPVAGGSKLSDGVTITGRVEPGGGAVRYDLDLAGAESFYIADWAGPGSGCDQTFSVNLVDVSNGNFPCTGGAVPFHVPDPTKPYRLEIAPAKPSAGTYRFTLITVKIRNSDIGLGTSHHGRIDMRGRVDRYTFSAGGATGIRLTGMPAACAPGLVVEVFDDHQNVVMGYRGLCGTIDHIALPNPNGRYAVQVRSDTLSTGDYTFTVSAG